MPAARRACSARRDGQSSRSGRDGARGARGREKMSCVSCACASNLRGGARPFHFAAKTAADTSAPSGSLSAHQFARLSIPNPTMTWCVLRQLICARVPHGRARTQPCLFTPQRPMPLAQARSSVVLLRPNAACDAAVPRGAQAGALIFFGSRNGQDEQQQRLRTKQQHHAGAGEERRSKDL